MKLAALRNLESKIDRFLDRRNDGKPIVLYGAGFGMPAILAKLERYGFQIAGICDSDPSKHGTRYEDRYDIFGLEDALAQVPDATFVITAPAHFDDIHRMLMQNVAPGQVSDVDLECAHYFEAHEFEKFFKQNMEGLERVRTSLADDASRDVFEKVIKAHLSGDRKDFQDAESETEDWYLFRSLLAPPSNAVYCDCGAYDGDTIRLFMEAAKGGFERIYAFEPDDAMRGKLEDMARGEPRIQLIAKGAYGSEGHLSFRPNGVYSMLTSEETSDDVVHVPVTTIDAVLGSERVDIIKMDIEGAEYDALNGAEHTIRAHKPKLAICLYHRVDDMLRIPDLVRSFVPEYELHIRHQSASCTDTILFAVAPDEGIQNARND
ncbi:MAG TPA: FkbM family methyltransferase [Hyphomicrobium sp.]|nr:FkbM family methyltransferase [Hyphomicrobium sp.]